MSEHTYKIGHQKNAKEIADLEKERDGMAKKCQEQEKDLDSQMQELGIPSYYRNYEAVVGIVAAYNLGWGNDLNNAIAAYEFNSSKIDDWGAAAFDPIRKADTGAAVNGENCYEDNINGNNAENVSRETFDEDTEVAVGTTSVAAAAQKTDYFSELYMRQAAYERYMEHKKNA